MLVQAHPAGAGLAPAAAAAQLEALLSRRQQQQQQQQRRGRGRGGHDGGGGEAQARRAGAAGGGTATATTASTAARRRAFLAGLRAFLAELSNASAPPLAALARPKARRRRPARPGRGRGLGRGGGGRKSRGRPARPAQQQHAAPCCAHRWRTTTTTTTTTTTSAAVPQSAHPPRRDPPPPPPHTHTKKQGAVILIGMSQVKYILGVKMPRAETLQENIASLASAAPGAQWQEAVMGCSAIAFLLALKLVGGRWPRLRIVRAFGPVTVCAVGIGIVASGVTGGAGKTGRIKTIGNIPQGLPPFSAGKWVPVTHDPASLLGLAVVVTLVDLLESTSIARALARKHGYALVYNQEVVGLGLANIAGAMFSAYTATGSFS